MLAGDHCGTGAEVTVSDDDAPAAAHRVVDGPPVSRWTDEPPRGADTREPGFRALATCRNAVSFGGLAITSAALSWTLGDPHIGGLLLLLVPILLMVWAALACVWVLVSSHRPAASLVTGVLGLALLIALVLAWPFSLRFSMARPELEAIAQGMLKTGTEQAPVRSQWLQPEAAWPEDGAVYFVLGTWVDDYGVVYDPDGSTPWSGNESLAPGWYQWMD